MISVIVPVYNAEKYLDRCIKSILSQTYTDIELLLIDDGSTDSSGSICDKYAQQNSCIRVFHKSNEGVSIARNLGIDKAVGEFLFFLDSDDWLQDDACEVLLQNMQDSNADCVVCGFNQSHGYIWAPSFNKIYTDIDDLQNDFVYWLNSELLSSSVNKLYKKRLIKLNFPVDMSFGEDLIFSLNYIKECNRITFITNPLYQHEVYNSTSLTHSFNLNRFREIEIIQENILKFAKYPTSQIYRKYVLDILGIVKFLFRQKEISILRKRKILSEWHTMSYFKGLCLKNITVSYSTYLYALLVQKGCWSVLGLLHGLNNIILKRR